MDPSQQPQPQIQPQPTTPMPVTSEDPGKTFAIISLVLAVVGMQVIGLVLAIIARGKSKKAGFDGKLATIGLILNIVIIVVGTVVVTTIAIASYNGIKERANAQSSIYK